MAKQAQRVSRSPKRNSAPLRAYPPGLGYTPRADKTVKVEAKSTESGMPCLAYVILYHVAAIGTLVWWHARECGVISPVQVLLATFCTINAWICVCEIALLVHSSEIQRQHASFAAEYGKHVLPPVFLLERVAPKRLFTLKYWAVMWSTYSALDPSYADTTTFGFCVDVGNGVTTIVPTIIFAISMSSQIIAPRWLGMLGLIKYYQEFYGTCVYFFQFLFNRRFEHVPMWQVWGVVVPANGIWIAFPLLGMWACSRLILEGSFEVFLEGFQLSSHIGMPSSA